MKIGQDGRAKLDGNNKIIVEYLIINKIINKMKKYVFFKIKKIIYNHAYLYIRIKISINNIYFRPV
jgi:hypothetical protein